jgi:hypothetical protein
MSRLPESEKGPLNELIEEMVKGYGAAKPRGGDRRSERAKDQKSGTALLNKGRGNFKSNRADTLAARLAESTAASQLVK